MSRLIGETRRRALEASDEALNLSFGRTSVYWMLGAALLVDVLAYLAMGQK